MISRFVPDVFSTLVVGDPHATTGPHARHAVVVGTAKTKAQETVFFSRTQARRLARDAVVVLGID